MIQPSETLRIVTGVIEKSLPKTEWTHQAHLRAGLWHVLHYDELAALDLMRVRIRAYNEATGGANTETTGYHETITRFYLRLIRSFLNGLNRDMPVDELADLVVLHLGDRELPLKYYSRACLFSPEARANWVPPDLTALPI